MGFLHTEVMRYQQTNIFSGKLSDPFEGNPRNQSVALTRITNYKVCPLVRCIGITVI